MTIVTLLIFYPSGGELMAGENEQRFEHGFATFVTALDYIESHLCEDISQEDIAAACFVSLSSLQKVWKYCTHFSLKDYITKRRLTIAGRLLLSEEVPYSFQINKSKKHPSLLQSDTIHLQIRHLCLLQTNFFYKYIYIC